MPIVISDVELKKDVDAYIQAGGNRSEAARLRALPRKTYNNRLEMAQTRFGMTLGKIVDGRVDYVKAIKRPLPKNRNVARYFLTSAQNNTHPHKKGFENLLAYRDWLTKRPGDTCELIIGTFSYQTDAYGAKAVKRGAYRPTGELWYAPELIPYFKDESIELAPGLVWCGEMNILPTAKHPLTGLDDYNGRNSNIVPHAKHAMESVASLADEATKFNYSTGTITQRNYIQKRAGIVAERRHAYGALIVEVDSAGNWYVRQLHVGGEGEIYDIGPRGCGGVRISDGTVHALPAGSQDQSFVEAITWGDIHAAEMDLHVRELGWSEGGMLDQLSPRRQFMHDIFSMRSRSHHELRNFHRTYQKFVDGEGSVEDEMCVTADFMKEAARPWCETVVVRSNHCRHLDRWLNEANPAFDPANARYFNLLQLKMLEAFDTGDRDFNILEWALRNMENGIPEGVRFLGEDESFVICKNFDGGVECGLHGDLGPNGARGSTQVLMKLGRAANKAHDHTAAIRGPVYSAGACSLSFPYMKGPNAHSVSHIVTFENAARQIITFWSGKFRA
jgi:hypothetical protein